MTTVTVTNEFLSRAIRAHDFSPHSKPLVIGISGPQGSGKSYVTEQVHTLLQNEFSNLNIVQFLMDDLYLTHADQAALTQRAKSELDDNRLLQGRGLPGTHDIELGIHIFDSIIQSRISGKLASPIKIPSYDKSLFAGEGDRDDPAQWQTIENPIDVVLFEGWFNGFMPLDPDQLRIKYLGSSSAALIRHKFPHIEDVNENLFQYTKIWNHFDKFVCLETANISDVYTWRLQQEHALVARTGSGMSDSQVEAFVDRYMPVYELYYTNMCARGVSDATNSNLRIGVDLERVVQLSTAW
ncbi:P-loop containing nucleoside triphosphate hydrolase protein [Suhomyces tanzawaensis NRRL Y-17324]|uniref:p-loop containing nucleoside triphosphate hydrolase protein n=1 Tax=Suhomyces tanzawaensis NRRL Y-17324 TaxID=984487 RepID=A0A1E4SJL5_9ASCO|nr:P-loop containing nucleoside triphosphate hydrolase protein [Suhomyces tanzawaensis NRRL Y-17324]ODV79627.1 P-loop containing nucleoside triphosphate hydrolase protein [Suhomyces tanzawaensis NRRL Y-17324]